MTDDLGPPGPTNGDGGQHTPAPAAAEELENSTTTSRKPITAGPLCTADTMAGLSRRRDTSRRMVPLDCGCPDPWPCRCRPLLSERMVTAGRDAARHLLEVGHTPILKPDTLRALWARGGPDRRLAQELYDLCGGD